MTLMERDQQRKRMRVALSQEEKEEKEAEWIGASASLSVLASGRPQSDGSELSSGLTLPPPSSRRSSSSSGSPSFPHQHFSFHSFGLED